MSLDTHFADKDTVASLRCCLVDAQHTSNPIDRISTKTFVFMVMKNRKETKDCSLPTSVPLLCTTVYFRMRSVGFAPLILHHM